MGKKKRNKDLRSKREKAMKRDNKEMREIKHWFETGRKSVSKSLTDQLPFEDKAPVIEESVIKETDTVYDLGNVKIVKRDDTPRNRKFEKIVMKTQPELKEYLKDYFVKEGKTVIEDNGYLFVDGTYPVLLSAHLDTVHDELPKEIVYENGTIWSPQGIGGDDRCGVYAIMRILKEIDCPVVFCEDEEIGGIGSSMFIDSAVFEDLVKSERIRYVIDLDRKGSDEAVYYELDNNDFKNFVEKEFWHFDWGSFTDICNICPELGVAGVNLSIGYHKQHTKEEYVVLSEMDRAIEETKALIKRTDPNSTFEYIAYSKSYGKYGYWNAYDDDDYGYYGSYGSWVNGKGNTSTGKATEKPTDFFYISYYDISGEQVEFVQAVSEYEAIGRFLSTHTEMTFNDIFDVGYEEDYDWSGFEKYGYDSVTVTR